MKKLILFCTLLVLTGMGHIGLAQAPNTKEVLGVMTFNIRYDNPGDGPFAWSQRRNMVVGRIQDHRPDIIGFQEVLHQQLLWLADSLSEYGWSGVGRDDGREAGEYAPIFYRKALFAIESEGHFWLSQNPDKPGIGWDAACTRIVTWACLRHRNSDQILFCFNTHFDHMGEKARLESARLVRQKIMEIAGKHPVILCGDFNMNRTQPAYALLTAPDGGLVDTGFLLPGHKQGPDQSYVGFPAKFDQSGTIDFILVSTNVFEMSTHLTDTTNRDGFFPSDHLPVFTKLLWIEKPGVKQPIPKSGPRP